MAEKYTVVRTDLMSATANSADLVSLRFYNGEGNPAEIENGAIVKLVALEDGEREVYKAVAATASDDIRDCALVASEEVMYDERKTNLDEFINEAGTIARGYLLRRGNIFSVTKPGFVGDAPAKGDKVGVGADGKLAKDGTNLGVCHDVEKTSRYTYYAVKVAPAG